MPNGELDVLRKEDFMLIKVYTQLSMTDVKNAQNQMNSPAECEQALSMSM